MARPLWLELEGARYYVLSRGNDLGSVIRPDKTRATFLKYMDQPCGVVHAEAACRRV